MNAMSALESQVTKDLDFLNYPPRHWVPPVYRNGERIFDVVVVGAGQCGLAATFGLIREKVDNIVLVDARPLSKEGPWTTVARMHRLRTPKHVTGPDLGVPSLTPRAWYEARYGAEAWCQIDRISRKDWQEYLTWFGRVLNLPLRNECKLTAICPASEGDYLVLTLQGRDGTKEVFARKLVLASGLEGNGCWTVPDSFRRLSAQRKAHALEDIDFNALAGKRIGILGSGASGFDNAATALEHGAARVDLCSRRPVIPTVNLSDWTQFTGFLKHFADMQDADRWDFLHYIIEHNQPPTQESFDRCRLHSRFFVHTSCPWTEVVEEADQVKVVTPQGQMAFDFVVSATGYEIDLTKRPEIATFAEKILLWSDRFTPAPGMESEVLAKYPYLSPDYQFLEKTPGTARFLRHIHNFTFGATASMGITGSSVTGIKYGAERLVSGITRQLYLDDLEFHRGSLRSYCDPELVMS